MHSHSHHQRTPHDGKASWAKRLLSSMLMNLIIPVVQIYGGILSGSMALISDALHNLSDFISLVMNYAALMIGKRGPTPKQTFGYKRVEIFATLISVALLYGAAFYMAAEAWQRFRSPQPISGQWVIWIALIGFMGNIVSALLLRAGSKVNLNMKSAFLHMLADAATSLGVAALGVLWLYRPWYWLDPVFSWMIVAMIFYSGWGLMKDSVLILMNATPPGIDLEAVRETLESMDGVREIHDLHVWNPSSDSIALAVHITVFDQMLGQVDALADQIRDILLKKFKIDHPTMQFECNSCNHGQLLCCGKTSGRHDHDHDAKSD